MGQDEPDCSDIHEAHERWFAQAELVLPSGNIRALLPRAKVASMLKAAQEIDAMKKAHRDINWFAVERG